MIKKITARFPRFDLNLFKVFVGVAFSLLWARVMYLIWPQPSFLIFMWFYLGVGSILLKWVLFVIMDRIFTKVRVKVVSKELDQSSIRVHNALKELHKEHELHLSNIDGTNGALEENLKQLEKDVLNLGKMVEQAMDQAVESLQKRDDSLATRVIENDHVLDRQEFAIRQECLRLIANSHLKAEDVRYIAVVLDIIMELERMGDYAEGIANISLMIGDQPLIKPLIDIPRMKDMGIQMLRGSLESFSGRDLGKAKVACRADDQVDALYDQVFRELILYMIEDPRTITQATRLIWVAHNLERFSDRVTNICEQVAFGVTGELVDIGTSKY